ncbi:MULTISPECIES: hypothetical protein [Roseivirga]|jgi:hypothetical protein|nr:MULTISPECIES: hypothetical protein [Roseivirga]MBO6660699.1 hypothetical protein [Roseivirga sp.]MBO6760120.1 hypothetical protein [Roseivirga sp.]MBO6909317.1 hypothetical protein [Roseivirga sp.]WPZ12226.1 hypothetical protein T7867_08890 [Roseivirga spongicola]
MTELHKYLRPPTTLCFAPRTTEAIEAMMKQPSPLDAFNLPDFKGKQ